MIGITKRNRLIIFLIVMTAATVSLFAFRDIVPQPEEEISSITESLPEINTSLQNFKFKDTTNYCLECHQDKEALIDTAKPEVVVETENEGAG